MAATYGEGKNPLRGGKKMGCKKNKDPKGRGGKVLAGAVTF